MYLIKNLNFKGDSGAVCSQPYAAGSQSGAAGSSVDASMSDQLPGSSTMHYQSRKLCCFTSDLVIMIF